MSVSQAEPYSGEVLDRCPPHLSMAHALLRSSLRWLSRLLLLLGAGLMGAALVNFALGWLAPHMHTERAISIVGLGFLGGSLLAVIGARRRRQRGRRQPRRNDTQP